MASSFYKCFKARMGDLGRPVPESIFGTVGTTAATIAAIAKAVSTYGTEVTLAELIGAGIITGEVAAGISEVIGFVGALAASFYVGACVGSLLACAIDKWIFGTALPASATAANHYFYNKTKQNLPSEILALMVTNPEMRGAKKNDTYEARLRYSGYGDFTSEGDTQFV